MRWFRRRQVWLAASLAAAVVAGLVAGALLTGGSASAATPLQGFESCADLLEFYQERARDTERGRYYMDEEEAEEFVVTQEADDSSAPSEGAAERTEEFAGAEEEAASDEGEVSETGTNVQERGVDEPDIIKTDGEYLYILRPQSLLIAEIVEGGAPLVVGRLSLSGYAHRQELLIGEGKALVIRQLEDRVSLYEPELPEGIAVPLHRVEQYRAQSELLEIDISNRAAPMLLRELDLDGSYVSARLVDGAVRVVLKHQLNIPWIGPWYFEDRRNATKSAEDYNHAAIESAKLSRWQPLFGFRDHESGAFESGYALDCTQTYAPDVDDSPAWQNGVSYLLSFDLAEGLALRGNVGVISDHPTLYGSRDAMYLATVDRKWTDTTIHRFDVADPLAPTYFGSGAVRGQLLSQWAMSEHNGYLRVATTIHDRWPTLSNVFVLQPTLEDGQRLKQVGLVSGLGVTETIFAVRFAGDVGYVVTFRQTDPLYVLDLSDPTDPQTLGELKIPGFSRYLHPLSGGLLLGIGRDADERTGRELGLQASLFDVSDPSDPQRIAVLDLGADARSQVESDHRAFRFHDGIAWIPVAPTDWRYYDDHDGAYLGVRVSAEGLTHELTLRVQGEARRALPIGEQIHLLSSDEVRTYSLESGESQGRISFSDEWDNRWLPPSPE